MSVSQIKQAYMTRNRNENEPTLLKYANSKRVAGLFNDVIVQAGGESIPANSMVLSCYCKYFETMFLTNSREKQNIRVEIHSCNEASVKTVIQYIYTGCIDIDGDSALPLLETANFLQMEDIKRFCFEFLESSLTVDTCIMVFQASFLYWNPSYLTETYHLIGENFDYVIETENFKNLTEDEFSTLLPKLDPRKVQDQSIYFAVINWTRQDESRKQDFPSLFLNLKLSKLPTQFLEKVVAEEPLVKNDTACLNAVISCIFRRLRVSKLNEEDEDEVTNFNDDLEIAESRILCIGGFGKKSVLEVYSTTGNCKKNFPDLPINLSFHCALNYSGGIYCLGGLANDDWTKVINKVYFMDLKATNLTWQQLAPMTTNRNSFGATIFNDNLVVAGGWNGNTRLETVELYKSQRNIWMKVSPMKHGRAEHALVAADDCLFVVGGMDESMTTLSSVERLDELNGNWENVQPLNTARADFTAKFCKGFIYALGGKNSISEPEKTIEKYDIANNQWSFVREMNVERYQHAACVLKEKIFVIGGWKSLGKAGKDIQCYDPVLDQWSIVDEMEEEVWAHAIAVA